MMVITRAIITNLLFLVFCRERSESIAFTMSKNAPARIRCQSNSLRAAFDFSSKAGWDKHYQSSEENQVEWHSSINLGELVQQSLPRNAHIQILVPGCGNSDLPRLLCTHNPQCKVVCLDSSRHCLDQLKERYHGEDYVENISYICGDAIHLSREFETEEFDFIFDKGLVDAILCDEGWNWPLGKLIKESATCLKEGGEYLLVSYRLPKSTQAFLQETGSPHGLQWSFDIEPFSDTRVAVSKARKYSTMTFMTETQTQN